MTELSGRSVEKHQICCVASVLLVCRVQEIVSNALSLLKHGRVWNAKKKPGGQGRCEIGERRRLCYIAAQR